MYFLRANQGIEVTTKPQHQQINNITVAAVCLLIYCKSSNQKSWSWSQMQSRSNQEQRHTTNVPTYFFRTDHELKINSEKQRAPFLLASPAHWEPGYEATFLSIEPLYLKRSSTDFCWSKIVIIFAKTSIITAGQRKGPDESMIHTTYYTPAIHAHKPNPYSCR